MRPEIRSERAQLRRDLLLAALAIVSVALGLYSLSQGDDPFTWLDVVDLGIVAVFWVDFVLEARRVGWGRYLRTHWWELPSLIPPLPFLVAAFPAVAVIRVVRLLRLTRVVSVLLRLRPAGAYLVRLARRARIDAILGVAAGIVLVATPLAYVLEREANPDMTTLGDSLWFTFNMFTNVAYLAFQPVTVGGRILSGILQLGGIAFIGIFTASLAGAIVKEPTAGDEGTETPPSGSSRRDPQS